MKGTIVLILGMATVIACAAASIPNKYIVECHDGILRVQGERIPLEMNSAPIQCGEGNEVGIQFDNAISGVSTD